jgi:hypothetical protein
MKGSSPSQQLKNCYKQIYSRIFYSLNYFGYIIYNNAIGISRTLHRKSKEQADTNAINKFKQSLFNFSYYPSIYLAAVRNIMKKLG